MTRNARIAAAVIAILLAAPCLALPHTLDEYLQAARLDARRDGIAIEIDLTPGVAVAPQVFALIDRDRDGRVSASEIERYARSVLQDIVMTVDDRAPVLTLTRAESPSWDDIRGGTGTIRVEAFAAAPLGQGGRHRVAFENRHQRAMGVYLVNALVPSTRDIVVAGQRRDVLQHRIDLDVDVATRLRTAIWLLVPIAGLGAVVLARRRL